MFIRLSFVTLIFAVAALGMPVKRNAATVGQDFEDLDKQVQALDASVIAYPNMGGTLAQIIAIHDAAENVDQSIMTTTNDANASKGFNTDKGNSILSFIKGHLAPDVKKGLGDLVAKETALNTEEKDIAKSDLDDLERDTKVLRDAIDAKVPASLKNDFMGQFNAMIDEIANAAQAYST